MGKNLQDLEESFKKGTIGNDGEEAWMGCMTCDQSFHLKCLLGEVTEEEVDEVSKDMEKKLTDISKKLPSMIKESETSQDRSWLSCPLTNAKNGTYLTQTDQ